MSAHARLVNAIRQDTLEGAAAAEGVARVVPVLDLPVPMEPHLATLERYVQQELGLNAGLTEAAAWAQQRWPEDAVAALVGDLPALHPEELSVALAAAAAHPRAHVADALGTGTTLLTALPGHSLRPEFGPGSAARHHSSGAVGLAVGPGLRLDVDTAADLAAALQVGLGPATTAVLAEQGSPTVHLGTA
jgi:2-phospho-L-lactate guanylyltransferase